MLRSKTKKILSIVIPTLNEEANVGRMIAALNKLAYHLQEYMLYIVVADSNSTDATHLIVQGIQKKQKNVFLLIIDKPGLGEALLQGKKFAFEKMKSDVIVTLDCDGSHDPKEIIGMIQKLRYADIIIGSRYITHGSIENWPIHRKIFSIFGNLYLKCALGVYSVTDYTSNFRVYSAHAVKTILEESHQLVSDWSYLCLVLMIANRKGIKLLEFPIHFQDRIYGESKLNPMSYISRLLLLGFKHRYQRFFAVAAQ